MPYYLAFIDKMSDESVKNIVNSAFDDNYPSEADSSVKVMFLHGTKTNEIVAAKAAKRLKNDYPQAKIVCRKGHIHCENALFHHDEWYKEVAPFLLG